jgi:hypothetical protein
VFLTQVAFLSAGCHSLAAEYYRYHGLFWRRTAVLISRILAERKSIICRRRTGAAGPGFSSSIRESMQLSLLRISERRTGSNHRPTVTMSSSRVEGCTFCILLDDPVYRFLAAIFAASQFSLPYEDLVTMKENGKAAGRYTLFASQARGVRSRRGAQFLSLYVRLMRFTSHDGPSSTLKQRYSRQRI